MIRYPLIALLTLALASAGCGDDGSSNAPTATAMFMGRYTPKSPVNMVTEMSTAVTAVEGPAEEHAFTQAEAGLQSGMRVPQWLSQLDAEFSGDAAGAGPNTLQGAIRDALARWRMAPTDANTQTATGETVEKTLATARMLSMHSELRAALTAIDADDWANARARWDRAAAWFATREAAYQRRSDTTAANVWGPGSNAITDENLATRTVDLLARGAQLLDARAADNARDAARQLLVYSTKYAFLSAVNYSTIFEARAAAMGDLEYPRSEGGALFEGVVIPFHARAAAGTPLAMTVSAARARWAFGVTAATGPTRLAVIRDSGALYAALTADGVTAYATATDAARAATRSTLRGVVDALDEALAYARQDPAALRAKITSAEARSTAGDHAGAATLLREVQTALDAVARAGM